ncbi:MAG: hypothetical protein QE263_04695 [Vampirovibrionales bacterium]|nr:hypothetical protein [Vampirovibrionales bacterium]
MTFENLCYSVGFSLLGVLNIVAWIGIHQRLDAQANNFKVLHKELRPLEEWHLSQ